MEPEIRSVRNGHEDTTSASSQDKISYIEQSDVEEQEHQEGTVPLHFSDPESAEGGSSTLSIDELYPGTDEADGSLARSKQVLRTCIRYSRNAQQYAEEDEWLKSDNEMVHVQNRLPDLFTYRDLGDGFGMVVDALLTAFENQNDMPCTLPQIKAVRRVLADLRDRPFMSSRKAVDLTLQLEDVDFDTDHEAMGPFTEWLEATDE